MQRRRKIKTIAKTEKVMQNLSQIDTAAINNRGIIARK